jgi:lipase
MIGVCLARLAPERVRRLILLDAAISLPPAEAGRRALDGLDVPTFDDPAHAVGARILYWPPAARPLAEREVAEHLVRTDGDRWRWRYNPAAVVVGLAELARPAVSPPAGTPTLLVVSTRPSPLPRPYLAEWRAVLGTDLTVVELDCGHQVHLELPGRTGELVRAHLS